MDDHGCHRRSCIHRRRRRTWISVVGGVISSQGSKFFQSGVVIFVAVLLHNGLGYLFGVFGGYTFSFIIASIVVGLIKGKKYKRLKYTIVAIIGVVIIDIVGMIWWKFNGNLTWKVAFLSGFVAFIPLDLVKAVIAAQLVPLFKRLLPEKDDKEANEQAKEA